MTALPGRPITILVAALGGEGGGVLADWLVDAATAEGYPVQSTSIPGVAQRTGATTYYLEIYPVRAAQLGGRRPVFALTPNPGNIDLMVASELIEAGRAMQNGFVSPDRTTLIASTHRIYAIAEKIAMADGRYDAAKVVKAAQELAQRAILFDFARLAQQAGTVINAVLFGAISGSGVLPIPRAACEAAIRRSGKAVESSLRGFAAGYACAVGELVPLDEPVASRSRAERSVDAVRRTFPPQTHAILEEAVARLVDYQDEAYARTFLARLEPILALDCQYGRGDFTLTGETGRHLALWMSYEDVIRVADLKTRADRFDRIRSEVGAKPDEPVRVVEFLKPGLDEACAVLPPWLARRLLSWARARGLEGRLNVGMHVKTSTVTGFLLLRMLAALRPWRRRTWRFMEEQARIERWLAAIRRHAVRDIDAAIEVAHCARLIKGYGDTHRRGVRNFARIFETLVEPSAVALTEPLAAAIRRAREGALADPEGETLDHVLAQLVQGSAATGAPARGGAVQAAGE